jgi:hypothetical protein
LTTRDFREVVGLTEDGRFIARIGPGTDPV